MTNAITSSPKNTRLEIRLVVLPISNDPEETMTEPALPFVAHDGMLINSGPYSGLECAEAIKKMSKFAEENDFGKATVTYRLKDWGISRQRYWGTPDPHALLRKRRHCPSAGERFARDFAGEHRYRACPWIATQQLTGVRKCDLPEVWKSGAPRNRHHGHLRRFVLVLLPLHRRAQRPRAVWFEDRAVLVSHRSIYWRS